MKEKTLDQRIIELLKTSPKIGEHELKRIAEIDENWHLSRWHFD